jgi:chromosome segregation protein
MNRASATIVFDNASRAFQLPSLSGTLSLDFDEISITREVFADGTNEYRINGSTVRLRDVHELIGSVHIGASGHHIISQGEADRLLNAKPAERREILEEALGLRLYHYRINESTKKLEKTRELMKETEILRRELAPHLKFLKKQVERVEQAQAMRTELSDVYRIYLAMEESLVTHEMKRLNEELQRIQYTKKEKTDLLQGLIENPNEETINHFQNRLSEFHTRKKQLEQSESELTRTIGRIEGTVAALSRVVPESGKPI